MTVDNELIAAVKRTCQITWDDTDTNARIESDIIPDAMAALIERLGIPDEVKFDFSEPGEERRLLLKLCYYMWNQADDEFFANYERDIAQCRRKWEVAQYVEETAGSSDL